MPDAATNYDLVIIGGGPAGYTAAIRAGQLGLRTAIVEKESQLGGTCLRVGCIPSKAMLESSFLYREALDSFAVHGIELGDVRLDLPKMLARQSEIVSGLAKGVEALMKKNKVDRYLGTGRILAPGRVAVAPSAAGAGASAGTAEPFELATRHILIATGSKVAPLAGCEIDGQYVATSNEAISYESVPNHLVVIGAGFIGMELGSVWLRLGAKVTVLEYMDRILPGADGEVAAEAAKIFRRQGFEFLHQCKVTSARRDGDRATVECEGKSPIHADRVLVAVGRLPNTSGLGLEEVGIATDARGRIPVDGHFATSVKGIYAVGDVIAGPMLAHKAEEEAVAFVEALVTGYGHVNYDVIPAVTYTHPEVASVGRTEEELQAAGVEYRRGKFPFRNNSRARTIHDTYGFAKVLADTKTDRILGVHIIGPRAGDLIAEAATAMEFGATAEDLARTCHAHPTLPEALREACLAVDGRAINA